MRLGGRVRGDGGGRAREELVSKMRGRRERVGMVGLAGSIWKVT